MINDRTVCTHQMVCRLQVICRVICKQLDHVQRNLEVMMVVLRLFNNCTVVDQPGRSPAAGPRRLALALVTQCICIDKN